MRHFYFLIILLILSQHNFGQTHHYDIYVMSGCSNCQMTKNNLDKNLKQFVFHNVDSAIVGHEMVAKLHQLGYVGNIGMPVIITNDSILLYPATKTNGKYISSNLTSVLEAMLAEKVNTEITSEQSAESNCEFEKTSPLLYIVCGSFDTEEQAKHMAAVLINRGYEKANYIYQTGLYRAYSHVLRNSEQANSDLQLVKTQYRGAFILTTSQN